jgi:hypothetical protein
MIAGLFLLGLVVPPAVIALCAVMLAVSSSPARVESSVQLREHHA